MPIRPALATMRSSQPNWSSAASTVACLPERVVRSAAYGTTARQASRCRWGSRSTARTSTLSFHESAVIAAPITLAAPVTIAARHVGSGVSRLSAPNGGLTDSGEVRMTKRSPQNEVGERRCCAGCFLLENVAGCVGVGSAHVGDELGVRGGQCRYPVELGGGGDLFFEVHEAL